MNFKVYPVNSFNRYYRSLYGQSVGKITLDTGLVCPNRSRGGCIYCSAEGFTPYYLNREDSLARQLQMGKEFLRKRGYQKYFSYFQQETTTALALEKLKPMLDQAAAGEDCLGLIVSTRPDYLDDDFLAVLENFAAGGKDALLELGLQSCHDTTLEFLNRNHSYNDFKEAALRVKSHSAISLGVHLILGLPGEDFSDMLETVTRVCSLGIDYIKFHHLVVNRGTALADMYRAGNIKLFTFSEYLDILAPLIGYVPGYVVLHRLWSTSRSDIEIAPCWNLYSYKLNNMLLKKMKNDGIWQGRYVEAGN
ncbi:MAG: TIGR01212 family radical SAM protein [Desulfobia sp.]